MVDKEPKSFPLDPTTLKQQIVKRLRIDSERVRVDTGSRRLHKHVGRYIQHRHRPYAFIYVERLTRAEEREVAKLIRESVDQDYMIEIGGGENPLFLLQESVLKEAKKEDAKEEAETIECPCCGVETTYVMDECCSQCHPGLARR